MYPAWASLLHPGIPVRFIIVHPLIVPESCARNNIQHDEDDQHNNVDDRDFPPALFQAGNHPSFAGITAVAQLPLIVAPSHAIRVTSD